MINTKTVIVGAGMAGIGAALNLLKNNHEDYLLLEVNDRIGGRCYTIDFNGGILEHGAQFIHGQTGNPLFDLAKEHNLIEPQYHEVLKELDNYFSEEDRENSVNVFLTQYGEKIDTSFANRIYTILNKIVRDAENFSYTNFIEEDRSVGEFVHERLTSILKNEFENKSISQTELDYMKRVVDGLFDWRCKLENLEDGCQSWYELSLKNHINFKELEGYQSIEILKGYKSIIDTLIGDFSEKFYSRLKLQHKLNKVLICNSENDSSTCLHCKYTKDTNKIVILATDKSTGNDVVILCDNVLCTMSLGYVKDHITDIIQPNSYLTEKKLNAIKNMGYGTINKIILEYEKPFWDKNLEGYHLIWLPEKNQKEKKWYQDICSLEPAVNHDNVIIAWIGGNEDHEELSDEAVSEDVTMVFRKFLSNPDLPKPKTVLRSNWKSNEYFKGSYCFYRIGCDSNLIDLIGEPIYKNNKPIVLFAGEATHAEYFSTVHGAYLSGIRESEKILKQN